MSATAGRVCMPANNRVHSSAALQPHGIWQSAIGYDPYAPINTSANKSVNAKLEAENPYVNFQGLMALARITATNSDQVARGACKKCGRVGHLTFQCRNVLGNKEKVLEAKVEVVSGFEKSLDGGEEEEESESSDSDVDYETERIIAQRSGKSLEKPDSSLMEKSGRSKLNRKTGDTDLEEVRRKRRRRGDDERRRYDRKSRKEKKRTSRR